MKQTAVEWLANELYEKFEMRGDGILYDEIINKAKEMEKRQIVMAFISGDDSDYTQEQDALLCGVSYYNEKFKK